MAFLTRGYFQRIGSGNFITSDDFSIKAENFELTKGWNILRIICGALMLSDIARPGI